MAPVLTALRTAAYGSAYCMVRLTPEFSLVGLAAKPVGAGSENAPYASMLGLGSCGAELNVVVDSTAE